MRRTLIVTSLILLLATLSQAQSPALRRDKPVNCEDFLAFLDHAIIEWQKLEGTQLILITRLGDGERDHKLSRARLYYVEDYLKRHNVQHVLAEGDRVAGFGRIEAYVGGKLYFSVALKRGSNKLCWGTTLA
jgi:hypothetical protein